MNSFYNNNQKQSSEALSIAGEATKITFDYSVNVWEKQVAMFKQNAAQRVSEAMSFQQWTSPEAVLNFQRQSGAAMLSDLQKFGEECYGLTDQAGKNLSEVAQKGRDFAEQSLDSTAKQMQETFPASQQIVFPEVVQQTAKTMGDICQNGMEVAAQAMRSGVETILSGQKAAAANGADNAAANGADAENGAGHAGTGSKRKQKRS